MGYPVFQVPAGDVLPVMFATYDGATGASITMTGLAVTDIEIYKDGSVTQRASDAGYTLLDTDGIDFDGITGIHGFSIDTGDNTDAGFYTVGAWFTVVVSAVTVDAQTVSFIACQFRLMAAEDAAGVPDVNVTHFGGTAGTFASGRPETNTSHIAGSAVSTTTAQIGVNVVQVSGDSVAADNLETAFDDTAGSVPWAGIVDQGTAQSVTGTTIVLRAAAGFANDELVGATVVITGGTTGVGQSRAITDYVGATDTATVDTWTTTPTGTITYKIYGTSPAASSSAPTAAQIADAVWDEAQADHVAAGSFGEVATEVAAILVDTAEIGAAGAGLTNINLPNQTMDIVGNITGNLSGSVGSVTGAVGSVTGAVGSVTGLTASDVGAIKAKTDSLTFTTAGIVDANVQQINDVTITGNGQVGTEFGV